MTDETLELLREIREALVLGYWDDLVKRIDALSLREKREQIEAGHICEDCGYRWPHDDCPWNFSACDKRLSGEFAQSGGPEKKDKP